MADQLTFEDREDDLRLRACWNRVQDRVQALVPPKMAERFLATLRPGSCRDGIVTILVPSTFNAEWVRQRCISDLQEAVSDELGETFLVELKIVAESRAKATLAEAAPVRMTPTIVESSNAFKPNPKYNFANYIVGNSNRLAAAGAKAVAAEPGKKFNPLFIYGPSGLGKTHLLHAIANEVLSLDPRATVTYITAQQFAEEFVASLQTGKIDQFRRHQRSFGVWLVDDIQFIVGKDRTQEEVFYTFNALQQSGRQIVFCSDRPPRELYSMNERLRSRFESGLVADISSPDTELKCAILRSKAVQEGVPLDWEVAMYLAENVPGNIRVLEGALTKLVAHASVYEQELGMDLARRIVEADYANMVHARPSLNQILETVSKFYRIPIEEIRGISRKAPIAMARHVAVYMTREVTRDSWKHIGAQFGDRDHTSMMHAHQKISEMVARDREFANTVKALIRDLDPSA